MSERIEIGRNQGEPLVFYVDLKWALWSADVDYWREHAPQTTEHLIAAFNGAFDEFGDTLVIHTAPRKEIRFGTVTIDPKANLVVVEFRAEFDDDEPQYERDEFLLPGTLHELLVRVDEVERRLLP